MNFFKSFKKQMFVLLLFVIAFVGARSLKTGASPLDIICAYDPYILAIMIASGLTTLAAGTYLKMRYYPQN